MQPVAICILDIYLHYSIQIVALGIRDPAYIMQSAGWKYPPQLKRVDLFQNFIDKWHNMEILNVFHLPNTNCITNESSFKVILRL